MAQNGRLFAARIGALDQAAPLAGRELPGDFATLRGLFEARLDKPGNRKFVQILRLLEVPRSDEVRA